MNVLIVKTSSLGDIIHTFPAITDAIRMQPNIHFDWLVEEEFVEIALMHPAIQTVIPISIRRWKKSFLRSAFSGEMKEFIKSLRVKNYDLIIDAQGLLKSSLPAMLCKGERVGYDKNSIKESIASLTYKQCYSVNKNQHAVKRIRQLFSMALDYTYDHTSTDYGLNVQSQPQPNSPYVIFFHSTTWASKHWPEAYWIRAAQAANSDGLHIKLPWFSDEEKLRANRIVSSVENAEILPKMTLNELAKVIKNASLMLGVDTGLSHLATALDVPGIVIYGSTMAGLTGVEGDKQQSLQMNYACSPCLKKECIQSFTVDNYPCYLTQTPENIWLEAKKLANFK